MRLAAVPDRNNVSCVRMAAAVPEASDPEPDADTAGEDLDALLASNVFDPARIGYWGLSMGTVLGLPFVAAEPRISAAVLGACGLTGSSAVRARFTERHRLDAPNVTCPVLFMVQWDDEIFDRDGALELFDLIGSTDKRLHAHPGRHGAFPREAAHATREFLAARLRAKDA